MLAPVSCGLGYFSNLAMESYALPVPDSLVRTTLWSQLLFTEWPMPRPLMRTVFQGYTHAQ